MWYFIASSFLSTNIFTSNNFLKGAEGETQSIEFDEYGVRFLFFHVGLS